MKMRIKNNLILFGAAVLLIVCCFGYSLRQLDERQQLAGRRQLEEAVRRSAVSCYATEGAYPPDLAYLQQHYGLRYNQERYTVYYQPIADNLLPDITVLEAPDED